MKLSNLITSSESGSGCTNKDFQKSCSHSFRKIGVTVIPNCVYTSHILHILINKLSSSAKLPQLMSL